ncbi:MAG: hypothetical protein HY238_18145 [Acidobacteria bacterium]|nr:hypothetical protein [Acidobacteriota bacterium]
MDENRAGTPASGKREWVTPRLLWDGDLRDLVLGGIGKLSTTGGDTGDSRKPPGGG